MGPDFWPVVDPLPEFLTGEPGVEDVKVKSKKTRELDPGDYGDVVVKSKGKLVFTGGTYSLRSFSAGSSSQITFLAATTLLVADKFRWT